MLVNQHNQPIGDYHHGAKLATNAVLAMRYLVNTLQLTSIPKAKKFIGIQIKVSDSTLIDAVIGRTWQHLPTRPTWEELPNVVKHILNSSLENK